MKLFSAMLTVMFLIGLAGCGEKEEPVEQTAAKVQPPAVEPIPADKPAPVVDQPTDPVLAELKAATYFGIMEQDPVTLKNGLWEGEPAAEGGASRPRVQFLRDFYRLGDIDGDGQDEAAVALVASSGGTGENLYVAMLGKYEGKWKNLDTVLVGDRVRIRKAAFYQDHFFMDLLRHGPKDAMCCPGDLAAVAWTLKNGKLTPMEVSSEPLRLSLDKIEGFEWVLAWWNHDERAPADPEVTLSYLEKSLGGSSGCNNYFVEPVVGDTPGAVTVGPVGGTRKMCPEDIMAVEQRFLTQLGGVKSYGYTAGMLALTYEIEGKHGTMLFEGRRSE